MLAEFGLSALVLIVDAAGAVRIRTTVAALLGLALGDQEVADIRQREGRGVGARERLGEVGKTAVHRIAPRINYPCLR